MAKYSPKTKLRLIELVEDNSVYLGDIDTSNITDMSELFNNSKRTDFSGIEKWDTSKVTNMERMFGFAGGFNHNINDWNVSSVTNMRLMFEYTPFNQPLDKWDTSSVKNMASMFNSSKFNQNINDWNVSNVEYMASMFESTPFNQPLNKWNVSKVTDMGGMFNESAFNHNINDWNVSSVENMEEMFYNNPYFNQPLDKWDISNVNNVKQMFCGATSFTQSIELWNVSNLSDEYMNEMFNKLSPLQCKELKLPSWYIKRFSKPKASTFKYYDYFTISAICQQLKLAYIATFEDYGFEKSIKKYPSKIAAMKEQRKSPDGIYNDCAMGYNPNEISVEDLQFIVGMDKEKCEKMCQNAHLAIVAKTKGDKISEILGVYDTILDALEAMPYKKEQCYLGYQHTLKANEVVGKDFNIVKKAIEMTPIKPSFLYVRGESSYWWVEVNDKGIITKIIKALENENNEIKDEIMAYKDDLPKADDKCHFEFVEIIISKGRD